MNERLRARMLDVRDEARFALDLVARHGEAIVFEPVLAAGPKGDAP